MRTIAIAMCATLLAVGASAQQPPQQRVSPHETVTWKAAGGKTVTISYGRPYLKGRKALGGQLVPYGKVWRTGADEATVLTTTADLMIGNLHVPAGSYSLFTLPSAAGWKLIVSKNAKQWGAFSYKESEDLGRVDMMVSKRDKPTEQFTIALVADDGANKGQLHMIWEDFDVWVPITVH